MNPATTQLIAAIATIAKDKQVFLSKTKLLKLLYLFDVEYFRQHRSTFTGFAWKFFHLGPWTNEIDTVLEDLVREEVLIARQSARPDFDSTTYVPLEDQQISLVLSDIRDEFALKRVLNAWIERQLGEILDHVYFHTEPMENAVRNTPLDFSVVPSQQPERYVRPQSSTTTKDARRIRQTFRERQSQLRSNHLSPIDFTPPRYDDEFFQAMAKLETDRA
ncbi:MAG: hypothetical protein LV473_22295 [Nitrospira sp.]|nr:hypothetical protein [Nitrospira sp.]